MDVLGIDLAKRSFDATLLMGSGAQHYASFANSAEGFSELAAWLAPLCAAPLHACMEATNVYWLDLASFLYAAGHTVSVVNPARIKGFALATLQRNKTDKLDSALIAAFCLKHQPKAWQPPSEQELADCPFCEGHEDRMVLQALPAAGVPPSDALGAKIAEIAREVTRLRGEVVFASGVELPDKDKKIVDKRKWD